MADTAARRVDLNNLSAEQLTALIADAQQALQGKQEAARASLIEEMTKKAEALGLSLSDLVPGTAPRSAPTRRKRSDAGKDVPVKYRGPNGETWSGRGRMPRWLHAAELSGRKREEFAA
ncbi:H-NS family nucleoid-associated regulatory protein [Muricoccus radiodurans]|uniref:H-NS histone family protein n=1 Tax=Muricoccus radiodurans TaxID=2231721 RepID=UPI003CEFE117